VLDVAHESEQSMVPMRQERLRMSMMMWLIGTNPNATGQGTWIGDLLTTLAIRHVDDDGDDGLNTA